MNLLSTDSPPSARSSDRKRWTLAYVGMLTLAGLALIAIVAVGGNHLDSAPSEAAQPDPTTGAFNSATEASHNSFNRVLLALTAVVLASQLLGTVFQWIHQPRVIGEVLAGILLGPSLLGRVWPEASAYLLPAETAPFLGVLAQLGVVLYMFLVGLEMNAEVFAARARTTLTISHASILAPLVLGAALALGLYGPFASPNTPFACFSLFMGVALSITAFPVLARILADRRIDKSELGVTALSCAAIGDVTAWCLLAIVVGFSQADIGRSLWTILLSAGYCWLMFGPIRRILPRLSGMRERHALTPSASVWVFAGLLGSSLVTDALGIHALFGAFVFGAIIPHDSAVATTFREKLEDFVSIVLLPAFFAYTGLRTEIGLVSGGTQWLWCAAIIAVATIGKVGGTWVAARLTGHDSRTSTALGVLMNTRGLMELIVLDIGLELGILSPTLFGMMVLMAIATTLTTPPLLQWVLRRKLLDR